MKHKLPVRIALSIFMAVCALVLSGCSKDDDRSGGGAAATPQPPPIQPDVTPLPGGPNGPFGQRLHKPNECPTGLIGRFRNVDPSARLTDRFMTLIMDQPGQLVLSWSPRPRRDRLAALFINGIQQNYQADRTQWTSRAICEAGRIVIVTNSQRLDSPAREWVLSNLVPAGPNSMRIDVNVNGAPAGQMQFNRVQLPGSREEDSDEEDIDDLSNEDLNDDEYEEIDPEDLRDRNRRDQRERERDQREQPERERQVRPRPVPPRVIVPPKKEVRPRPVAPLPPQRQQPPHRQQPPREVTPPEREATPKRPAPPQRETPTKREEPPKRITPPVAEVDASGCPFILGEYELVGDGTRMSLALVSFRRNESGVLVLGGQSGDTKLPDIILDGQTRSYGTAESAGGSVTGQCAKGSIVVKRKLSDNSQLRLDISKSQGNEVTIKSQRGEEMKTFRYEKKK